MDEQDFVWEKPITLIYGPYLALKKGTYRAEIEYSCSSDQTCYVRCERSRFDDAHLRGGEACLSRNQSTLQYDFEVTQDVEDFEFVVEYDGKGYLQVTDIEIVPSPLGAVRNICFVLALFLCLDVCFLLSDRIRKEREFLAAMAGIALLASLPLFAPGVEHRCDIGFHLMRIAGIARELRLGHVPVRLSSAWMEGYGYPVSVYYGDLLLYIPALMSLLGFSITTAYKFYVFLINVGTAVTACYGMHRICRDRRIALLASLAYCTASYRLLDIYTWAAVGEYSATMFLPLIAAAVYGIYMDDAADCRRHRDNALLLAAGMSGVILTHTLSVDMTFFTLLFVCVALLKRTFRKEVISQYLLAVLATCGLCMYFIVPFLDYMASVPVKVNSAIDVRGGESIQYYSVTSITDYFTFGKSPGLVLLAVFLAAVVYCTKKRDQEVRWLTVGSGLSILVTLNIFPWDYLAANSLFFALMAQIQFQHRYICIVTVFLMLLFTVCLQRLRAGGVEMVRVERLVIAAGFIMTCLFTKGYIEDGELATPYSDAELDSYFVVGGEYLRAGVDLDALQALPPELFAEEMEEAEIVERRGSDMRLYCRASDAEGLLCVPMFYYKGYHVTDDEGNEYPIEDGDLKQIKVFVPPGFEGYLNIEYREPWYWRAAEVVSLVSAIGLAAYLIRRKEVKVSVLGTR